MNTQKHTQGPWKSNYPLITAQGSMALTVAVVLSREDNKARADSAAKTKDEAMANAQLIAAAPDLLAVAKALAEFADGNNRLNLTGKLAESVGLARAAIAKAEGVQ